jgi:hypothetical protein
MITVGQDTQKRAEDLPTGRLCHRPGVAPSGRSSQEASAEEDWCDAIEMDNAQVAAGLAVGVGLVITVSAASAGARNAQSSVLSGLEHEATTRP